MSGCDGVTGPRLGSVRLGRLAGVILLVAMLWPVSAWLCPAPALGDAGFTFVPDPAQPTLPAGGTLLNVAELTGNGVPDLIVGNAEGNAVGVMLGNGAGGFATPSWYPVAGRPVSVGVADFNDDGHPDLLVGVETKPPPTPIESPLANQVQILLGDGQGSFTAGPPVALPERGYVYAGDFTDDGNEDVVVTPDACSGEDKSKYYMLIGDGHGDLLPGPVSEPRSAGCSYFIGDFTGSGRDDLLTKTADPGEQEAIVVIPSQSNGSFGEPIVSPTPQLAKPISVVSAVGDLDGDGIPDVITKTLETPMGHVEIFRGNGVGGFSEVGSYLSEQPGIFTFEAVLGEFAQDGHLDIATLGSQLSVLANSGAGVFSPILSVPQSTSINKVFVADVNGDGRPDLIVYFPSEVHIFLDEPVIHHMSTAAPPPSVPVPVIQNVRESAKRWREGGNLAEIGRKRSHGPPIGTTFSFSLNEQATVGLRFTRSIPGHRSGRRCVAGHHGNDREGQGHRKGRDSTPCEQTTQAGTLTFSGHAGVNETFFQGGLSSRARLEPGNYTLALSATNSAGTSPPAELRFTIVGVHRPARQRLPRPR